MLALVRDHDGTRLSRSHPEPEPATGDALITVRRTGISGLDRAIAHGHLEHVGVLGHEFVGEVESVGSGSDRTLVGQRVVGSIILPCGRCDLCLGGLRDHCRERRLLGMDGCDGCHAEKIAVPLTSLQPVPDDLDDDHAVFSTIVAAAIHTARQVALHNKPYVTVLGDGPLGLVTAQLMAKQNASVRLIGRLSEHLAICEKWGVKHRHADDIGRRADQDVVVDASGTGTGLELAMQMVRPRGAVILKSLGGPHAPGVDLRPVVLSEVQVTGSFGGPVREAVAMLARREIDVLSLITRRLSLADAGAALSLADQPGSLKVLLDC